MLCTVIPPETPVVYPPGDTSLPGSSGELTRYGTTTILSVRRARPARARPCHSRPGSAPPARADIEVQPGPEAVEMLITITPLDGATVRGEDAAAETALARLAVALGGTAQARLGAFPWRVRIALPAAAADR